MNDDDNICPICLDKKSVVTSECGHSYCLGCLLQINKCAICRRVFVKKTLNRQIANEVTRRSRRSIQQNESDYIYLRHKTNRLRCIHESAFVQESIFQNNVDFGRHVTLTVSRTGDLVLPPGYFNTPVDLPFRVNEPRNNTPYRDYWQRNEPTPEERQAILFTESMNFWRRTMTGEEES